MVLMIRQVFLSPKSISLIFSVSQSPVIILAVLSPTLIDLPSVSLRKLHKTVLEDIEKAVSTVISERLDEVESSEDYQNEAVKT